MKILRFFLLIVFLLSLTGCNFPLERNLREPAAVPTKAYVTPIPLLETTAPPAADFDPLNIDCLVGTWDVDSSSLLYAGNMLIGSAGMRLTNVSPHLMFRFEWEEPLLGSTYNMEVWYMDVLISAVYVAGDSEHLLDAVFNGSTTAYFRAGASAGSFDYQNDPERADMKITKIKIDGIPIDSGVIPLNDLVRFISSSTMYYTCESPDVITLRDKNAVESITLNRVTDDALPVAP